MATSNRVIEAGAWALENGHRAALKLTGGRWPKKLLGMEPLELFTTGRRSGERRGTLLTAPLVDGDTVIVVASKGGHESNPAWYLNLVADPEVEIERDGITRPYTARTADAAEKAELWPRIVAVAKNYEGYQRNTDRDIPVVICEPR